MNADVVRDWVIEQGLLGPEASAVPLAGGVSCEVFSVTDGRRSVVVKHAGPTLRVAAVWHADPRRVVHEGEVLEAVSALTPDAVPTVLAIDGSGHMLAMSQAPPSWVPWKHELLAERADPDVARQLGRVLATWHRSTWGDRSFDHLDDYELFEALRLEPYFVATQAADPRYEQPLAAVTERLRQRRLCLVHGDFSPKNVLIGDGRAWVLDLEVAHIGDPQFDLAFLLSHLVLKAIHHPNSASAYRHCATAFLSAYRHDAPTAGAVDGADLCLLLGAVLAARVHGKSPVEYLDDAGRQRSVLVADALLFDGIEQLDGVWNLLERRTPSTPR